MEKNEKKLFNSLINDLSLKSTKTVVYNYTEDKEFLLFGDPYRFVKVPVFALDPDDMHKYEVLRAKKPLGKDNRTINLSKIAEKFEAIPRGVIDTGIYKLCELEMHQNVLCKLFFAEKRREYIAIQEKFFYGLVPSFEEYDGYGMMRFIFSDLEYFVLKVRIDGQPIKDHKFIRDTEEVKL